MSETTKPDARTVHTVAFRMSFPTLPPMAPKKDEATGRETFGVVMLLPPGTDLAPYKAALKAAMVEKFGPNTAQWPKVKRKPDDVVKDFAAYNAESNKPLAGDWAGWTMVGTAIVADYPPSVVHNYKEDGNRWARCVDKREIFGGRWARAEIQAYYYPNNGGGVTFGLRGVQLLKRDTAFGAAPINPDRAFADDVPEEYRDDGDAFETGAPVPTSPGASAPAGNGWD
jgi:hypothetical protein